MAKIFKPSSQSKKRTHKSKAKQMPDFTGVVSSYDHRGKGVIKTKQGKVAFVNGALVGETVRVRPQTYTEKVIDGDCLQVLQSSPERIEPSCEYFAQCGGCQLQYMNSERQIDAKQQALDAMLTKQLKLEGVNWHAPIMGNDWQYRRTARLVTWYNKDKSVTLGFREAKSKHIVDVEHCQVLVESLSNLISPLKKLLADLSPAKSISHVQLYSLPKGDVVILRTASVLSVQSQAALVNFAETQDVQLILEFDDKRFEQIYSPATTDNSELDNLMYHYKKYRFDFNPNNFIQVNEVVNEKMIAQALEWLSIESGDTVLDLFSGVGNFTLPLADSADLVFAVEGVNDMVKQIKHNAVINGFDNIKAYQADLSKLEEKSKPQWLKPIDKLLLDPARDGAHSVVKKIPLLRPKKILYVSCNPATMIRDLKVLQDADYQLTKMGLLNMFPQTSHVEAMALLELN